MSFPSGDWSFESSSTHNVRMERLEMLRFLWMTKCDFFVLLGRFNETWWQIFWKRSQCFWTFPVIGVYCQHCSKLSLLYMKNLCVSHPKKVYFKPLLEKPFSFGALFCRSQASCTLSTLSILSIVSFLHCINIKQFPTTNNIPAEVFVYPGGNYLLKFNNRSTRTRCEICSKLTIKTPKRRHWRRSGVFIVNFEHISHHILVFLLLTLNM